MRVRDSGIPSVCDVVPDAGDLYREVFQEHFSSTNLQVIAVFKARSLLTADACKPHLCRVYAVYSTPAALSMILINLFLSIWMSNRSAVMCRPYRLLYLCEHAQLQAGQETAACSR